MNSKIINLLLEDAAQSDFKRWITPKLKQKGIAKILGSSDLGRGGMHIRFQLEGELSDFQQFFDEFGVDVMTGATSSSGTFPTYDLVMREETDGIPAGTTLPWVNNYVGAGSSVNKLFGPKDLTPDDLELAGKKLTVSEIISATKESIQQKYPEHLETLSYLMDLCNKKGSSFPFSIDSSKYSSSDLATISKNFGEVLGAIWSCNNLSFKSISFPSVSNEKLIDFYGERLKIEYPVSVKSGGGGKVTVQNIVDALADKVAQGKISLPEHKVYKIIEIVNTTTMKEGFIELNKYLNTPAIQKLSEVMQMDSADINIYSIKEFMDSLPQKEIIQTLSPFWKAANDYKFTRRVLEADDRVRFIVAPLGDYIAKYLNNDHKEYRESLTNLARNISMVQLNVDVTKSVVYFSHERFKNAEFKFDWAGFSAGNKLGFLKITEKST